MWEFTHAETIDASPETVFRVISDLPNYKKWNPFLIIASGQVEIGSIVSGKSVLGKFTTSYRHKIFEYIPNRSLCWRDSASLLCSFAVNALVTLKLEMGKHITNAI